MLSTGRKSGPSYNSGHTPICDVTVDALLKMSGKRPTVTSLIEAWPNRQHSLEFLSIKSRVEVFFASLATGLTSPLNMTMLEMFLF